YEANYEGRPPIYDVGCAGVITHSHPFPDGRYDIVLRGIVKCRVVSEDDSRPYRMGHVETIAETIPPEETQRLRQQRQGVPAVVAAGGGSGRARADVPPPA